ncbi:CBS domain-containing protein [Devosia rhodophyticola]|uniref:CBS domain-containing protein n=1 Tax=Devosia rhodophyticola TaxID=3026423 RepID=A0ABY7YVR2_9HYPH|nr:CBS domain-containing protein [Devosia rhodophyticola]WDR05140.1 CBS domain-containing protein [Devosia rhodophyticola]
MLVDTILGAKGSDVKTLPASATVADAVDMLNTHNIGAVIVAGDDGSVMGIFSERDLVRHLGKQPADSLTKPISALMTSTVVTCSRDTSIDEVMERMTSRRIRHVPVLEGSKLIGIISIGDVVKFKIEQAERDAEALRDYIAS